MNKEPKTDYSDIHYVKTITLGSVNPNNPLSEESRRRQSFRKIQPEKGGLQ